MEICNAKITKVSISMADHGVLTFYVYLEGSGWGIGYGGYVIAHGYLDADEFTSESGCGLEAMMHIMDVVGVSKWEELPGKYVRCKMDGVGAARKVDEIGNIIRNKWFNIREFFTKENVKNE